MWGQSEEEGGGRMSQQVAGGGACGGGREGGDPSARRTQGLERAAIADPGAGKAPVPGTRL